jgi:hypothetical protein
LPHLVFGGELSSLDRTEFKDLSKLGYRGDLSELRNSLRRLEGEGAANGRQRADAIFYVHLHRLLDPDATGLAR